MVREMKLEPKPDTTAAESGHYTDERPADRSAAVGGDPLADLQQRALTALEQQMREHERNVQEREQRDQANRRRSNREFFRSATLGLFGVEVEPQNEEQDEATVDGVHFYLWGASLHAKRPCPDCDSLILSYRLETLADVGRWVSGQNDQSHYHAFDEGSAHPNAPWNHPKPEAPPAETPPPTADRTETDWLESAALCLSLPNGPVKAEAQVHATLAVAQELRRLRQFFEDHSGNDGLNVNAYSCGRP